MSAKLTGTMRLGAACTLAACLASPAAFVGAQSPAAQSPPGARPAAKAAAAAKPKALRAEELMPMTCAQAWAAAGKQYPAMYDIVATLATVSLTNRDLTFPNTKEAGIDAGTGIAKDCEADPQGLLFGIVDRHVRRVAQPAAQ